MAGCEWAGEVFIMLWEHFEGIIGCMGDPVFVKDRQYWYVFVNDAAFETFGVPRERTTGRTDYDLFPKEQADVFREQDSRIFATGEEHASEEQVTDAHGNALTIVTKKTVYTDKTGEEYVVGVARDITGLKRTEEALRRTSAYHRSLIDASLDPLVIIGADGRISDLNPAAERITGLSREEIMDTDFFSCFTEPEEARALGQRAFRDGMVRDCALDLRYHDGRVVPVLCDASVYRDENGQVVGLLGVVRDITDRRRVEAGLKESEERYRIAIEHSNDGVAVEKGGRHMYVNQKFLDMFGYESFDEVIQDDEHKEVHPDDREMVMEYARRRQRGEPAPSQYDYRGIRKDGTTVYIEVSVALTVHEGEPASLAYLRDVSLRKQLEERLEAMSATDELTGLYNRRGFLTLSRQQLKLAERTGKGMELFFIDLDDLKQINDTLGHQQGDEALIDVSAILRQTFRKSDIIGRIGGDEFAAFAINTTNESGEAVVRRLNGILDTYNRSKTTRRYQLSLSVGTALFDPGDPASLEDLIAKADNLMYQDKKGKKHRT
jgi:diguanylate cyclase (GGDEF)-like protein/PAS domain S-box-containing protein